MSKSISSGLGHIPGPWYTKLSSLPLLFYTLSGRRIFFVDSLHKSYGNIVRISPTEVSVCDPAAVKQIYSIGTRLEKTKWYQDFAMSNVLGLFELRDTAVHGKRRKLLAGPLSKTRIRNTWERTMIHLTGVAVKKLQQVSTEYGKVDVAWWWRMMTADVAGKLVFGENFNMIETGEVCLNLWWQCPALYWSKRISASQRSLRTGCWRSCSSWLTTMVCMV